MNNLQTYERKLVARQYGKDAKPTLFEKKDVAALIKQNMAKNKGRLLLNTYKIFAMF